MRVAVETFLLNSLYWTSRANLRFVGAVLYIILGESHVFWAKSDYDIDCYLLLEYEMPIQWVVRDVASILQTIILSSILYSFVPRSSFFRRISLALLLYTILDLGMYFISMKRGYYGSIYFAIAIVLCIFNHRTDKTPNQHRES